MTKTCTKCSQEKPLDEFYKIKDSGGLTSQCKKCVCKKHQEYYQKTKEYRAARRAAERTKQARKTKLLIQQGVCPHCAWALVPVTRRINGDRYLIGYVCGNDTRCRAEYIANPKPLSAVAVRTKDTGVGQNGCSAQADAQIKGD